MKIIERVHLDVDKWNELVSKHSGASFFSYSWYLDAVAENWCVLVNDDYSSGVALPYTNRMGVEILYIPIFGRFMKVFGKINPLGLDAIKQRFKVREISTETELFGNSSRRSYQVIEDHDNRNLSSQAKRSLKKAEKEGVKVQFTNEYTTILKAIRNELEGKFKGVDKERINRLEMLFKSAKEFGFLCVFEVSDGSEAGGIVCFQDENQLLYVKGACPEKLKRNGGMYLALNSAIEHAMEKGLQFDFGGSNIDGVKRFNHNLGGSDREYFYHEVNEGPIWFKLARKFKNRLNR